MHQESLDLSFAAVNNRDENSPGESSNEKALKAIVSKKLLDREDRMNVEAIQKSIPLKTQPTLDSAEGAEASKSYLDMIFKC